MSKNRNYYAVIMAGGVGSRFWPASRSNFPKQFLDILGVGKSLLQQTYDRFSKTFLPENIFIVTNAAYSTLVKEQIPEMDESRILGEPIAKNTAACIAYSCGKILKINTHAVCIVAPSDHLILDDTAFLAQVESCMEFAKKNPVLVTLGIKPTRPDTGYGYIQYIEEENSEIYKVKTFTEKPSLDIAKTLIASGDFLWNAGIFIWSISTIRSTFKEHLPEQHSLFKDALSSYFTPAENDTVKAIYEQSKSISIDVGIMEKASNVYVMPGDFGWSDLGTWSSLYEIADKDANNNVFKGKNIVHYDTHNCMVRAPQKPGNKIIVLNGVKDLIVVCTDDVLFISDINKEQEVKQVATDIKIKFNEKYT